MSHFHVNRCNLLKQAPFTACNKHVDPEPFITACTRTLCKYPAVDGLKCQSLEAYARACSHQSNVTVKNWRKKTKCRKSVFGCVQRWLDRQSLFSSAAFLDVCLQLLSLRSSVNTGSAVLMSSVVRTVMGNRAASVGPFLPPSTYQQALLVSQLWHKNIHRLQIEE